MYLLRVLPPATVAMPVYPSRLFNFVRAADLCIWSVRLLSLEQPFWSMVGLVVICIVSCSFSSYLCCCDLVPGTLGWHFVGPFLLCYLFFGIIPRSVTAYFCSLFKFIFLVSFVFVCFFCCLSFIECCVSCLSYIPSKMIRHISVYRAYCTLNNVVYLWRSS